MRRTLREVGRFEYACFMRQKRTKLVDREAMEKQPQQSGTP